MKVHICERQKCNLHCDELNISICSNNGKNNIYQLCMQKLNKQFRIRNVIFYNINPKAVYVWTSYYYCLSTSYTATQNIMIPKIVESNWLWLSSINKTFFRVSLSNPITKIKKKTENKNVNNVAEIDRSQRTQLVYSFALFLWRYLHDTNSCS